MQSMPDLQWRDARGKRRRLAVPRGVFRRERGGALTLIVPENGRHRWSDAELPLRSLAHDRNGTPVSVGLPKFFDPDVRPDHAELAERADDRVATIKMDGTLIIRAVVGGRVRWRTRSSLDLGDRSADVMALASAYPLLADPAYLPGISVQFEHTTPARRIVIAYPEPALTLIGATDTLTLTALPWEEIGAISARTGVPAAARVALEGTTVEDWQAQVNELGDIEGVVVRWDRGRRMLRVKSDDYRLRHALRYDWPAARLAALLDRSDPQAHCRVENPLLQQHLDTRLRALQDADARYAQDARRMVDQAAALAGATRREHRSAAQQLGEPDAATLMGLIAGRDALPALRAYHRNECCAALDAATMSPLLKAR